MVARLNLPNMAHAPEQRVEVYARAVEGLLTLERNPEKQLKYLDFVDIYAALDDTERQEYRRRYPEEVKKMSAFAERFMEQGRQQGEAAVLLRQMERKYGPEAVTAHRARIEAADAETLLTWSERILTAATPDELFH